MFWREWGETYGLALVDRVIKVKRIFRVSCRTILHRLAASYEGWGNIWARFRADDERATGRSLCGSVEPLALAAIEFDSGAPKVLRVHEPDQLSAGDFRDDRLSGLVRRVIEAEEISLGRGAEVLGLWLEDMRAFSASWVR